MAKVTSKYQVTVPRTIADRYSIRPGDEIHWIPAGDVIRVAPGRTQAPSEDPAIRLRLFDQATERHSARTRTIKRKKSRERGWTREDLYGRGRQLIPTLVYRFDSRFPEKQKIATDVLRRGILDDSVRLPHQAIVEFIAPVTRPIRGYAILPQADALREGEELLRQFTVLYPNEAVVRNAIRGCATYQLSWFDAHLWSYAEHYGLSEIITEDLEHDRLYGTVRAVNPFIGGRRAPSKRE